MIYFDNSATSPIDGEVLEAIRPASIIVKRFMPEMLWRMQEFLWRGCWGQNRKR